MPRNNTICHRRIVAALCVVGWSTSLFACLVSPLYAAPPQAASENTKAIQWVRTALKTDADQGTTSNRRELLADVVERAPDCAPARWHSGYIQYDGKWRTPDEVQTQASADPRMQQYLRLRAEVGPTLDDRVALAQWCRKNKLETEERIEWLRVLEADPNHPEALSRLHLRLIGGMLLTPEQHQQYLALRRKVDDNIKTWKPRVTSWQRAIERGTDEERQAALTQLSQVTDMAAVLTLEWSVRSKDLSHQAPEFRRAVIAILDAMRGQEAIAALVRIAATATEAEVCDAAADALRRRPIQSYAPMLLAAMASPVESEFTISNAGGNIYYQHRFFRNGADINEYAESNAEIQMVGILKNGYQAAADKSGARATATADAFVQASAAARATEIAVAKQNQIIRERNQRLKYILTRSTGTDLPSDPKSWWNWWQNYTETHVSEVPVLNWSEDRYYGEYYAAPYVSLSRSSCFLRGTPVWTLTGKKPVESIQVGDQVLSQHPSTGELAYKPVLRTTVRPPSPTVQIVLPGETLTATRGHNFWCVGSGWLMAKNLKPAVTLYAVPSNVTIQQITEGEPAEAYNLVVADFNTYFVGESRILTHDNTLPGPSTDQFVPGLSIED